MQYLLKNEGKLYYGRWILKSFVFVFGLALFGALLHAFVIFFPGDGEEITTAYLATFFGFMASVGMSVILSTNLRSRFRMLISMGQKRKEVLMCENIYMVIQAVINYCFIMTILLIESNLYRIIYKGIPVDEECLVVFKYFPVYSIFILLFMAVYFRLISVLGDRYGMKVYTIGYLLFMAVIIGVCKIGEFVQHDIIDGMLEKVFTFAGNIPGIVWAFVVLVIIAVMVIIYNRILYKMDV